MGTRRLTLILGLAMSLSAASGAMAQSARPDDAYRPPIQPDYGPPSGSGWSGGGPGGDRNLPPVQERGGSDRYSPSDRDQFYRPPGRDSAAVQDRDDRLPERDAPNPNWRADRGPPPSDDRYGAPPHPRDDRYRSAVRGDDGYGQPYAAPPPPEDGGRDRSYSSSPSSPTRGYYSQGEILEKGRGFFGSIAQGLASAIEYTYQQAGRPNGYLLGEDGGGAFFAGLRYGEGTLYTKDAGDHKVYWQGPSLGYDVGGEGSKVMVLAYNLADPGEVYHRFGGVEGSAYVVGGVSVQFQKHDDVTLAIIRSGVGLRLGANVGYLKYTRSPTWNPF